jgi:hypothetical protein
MMRLFAALALPALTTLSPVALGNEVHVNFFGAIADDGVDDTDALRAAFAALQPGDKIVFATDGVYNIFGAPVQRGSLRIDNKSGVEVAGKGATLLVDNFDIDNPGQNFTYQGVIRIEGCRNTFIHDLKFDMSRAPFSQGTYTGQSSAGIHITFDSGFPVSPTMRVEGVLQCRPDGSIWGKGADYFFTGSTPQPAITQIGSSQDLAIQLPGGHSLQAGQKVIVRHRIYGNDPIRAFECNNTSIEDVTIYSAGGMGVLATGCADITVNNLTIEPTPGSGRLLSTCADATHFSSCSGQITITDSSFSRMGDDGSNVHGEYQDVVTVDSATKTVTVSQFPNRFYTEYAPGDRVEFRDEASLELKGDAQVVAFSALGGSQFAIEVDLIAPGVDAFDLTANLSHTAQFLADGVTVSGNRARGFLVQNHDALIRDCTFDGCTGPAINITTDNHVFHEATGPQNVTVRDCTITGVNKGAAQGAAAVDIFAEAGGSPVISPAGVIEDVTIQGCTFSDTDRSAIRVASTRDCLVTRNSFSDISLAPPIRGPDDAVNCSHFQIRPS